MGFKGVYTARTCFPDDTFLFISVFQKLNVRDITRLLYHVGLCFISVAVVSNPCQYSIALGNACGEDSNYTCADDRNQGICMHKCSLNKGYCGDHGVCFYSYAEKKIACRFVFGSREIILIIEPVHDKTNNLGFRPGPTQTSLYSHRRNPES